MHKSPSISTTGLLKISTNGGGSTQLIREQLKQGEIIHAKVLHTVSHTRGEVMLQIGDSRVVAQTDNAVKQGDIVQLKVVTAGKETLLQIVSSTSTSDKPLLGGVRADVSLKKTPIANGTIKLLTLPGKIPTRVDGKFEAKVLSNSNHQSVVRLLIGQQEFAGVSTSRLMQGQTITLQVVNEGRLPQLQILSVLDPQALKNDFKLGSSSPVDSVVQPKLSIATSIKIDSAAIVKELRAGDLLVARVLANNIKGELTLQIGRDVVKAMTEALYPKGEQIYLKLVKGAHQADFELIEPKEYRQLLKLAAYRAILPRQQNLAEPLQKLINIEQNRETLLPPKVKEFVESLVKQLPTADRVSNAAQLRQALSNTGLLTEAKLLAGLNHSGDLKKALGHILSLIRPLLPERHLNSGIMRGAQQSVGVTAKGSSDAAHLNLLGDLLRHSDSAVARIQIQQLASLPQDESTSQVWHFELPVHNNGHINLFTIQVEREGRGDSEEMDEETPWSITLQVNLSPLGAMRVQLKLVDNAIATIFWAEEKHTLQLINQNISKLKDAFEKAGLVVNGLQVLHGQITTQDESFPEDISLLNVKV